MTDRDKKADPAPRAKRKPYTAPRVVSYGHVKDLVQGATGKMVDAVGRRSKACWIAEALYGVDDARTLVLRAWLAIVYEERRSGWMFVAVYRAFGRQIAALIHRGLLPRQLFRPLFDALVERAVAESALALAARR